jgi:hypothetical protein
MQQRKGTAAQWTASNPILNSGEIGYESDTNKFKIGDGTNLWATLPYFLDEDSLDSSLGGYLEDTLLGANNGIAQLNSIGKLVSTQIPNVDEITQDAINTALVAGTGLDKTYDDAGNTITLDIDSTVATLTGTQTLTNKTLTTPVISSITNGAATLTLPGSTGTIALTTDITTSALANDSITAVKLAGDAVTSSKIQNGAVETAKIADSAVTSAKIANDTIVDADINSAAAIAQSKISGLTTDLAAKAPLASPTFTGTVVLPGVSATGHIIPFVDNTYDLGSPTKMWKDIYVGPGSLYVNGSKVLSDVSGAIVVSADPNENLGLRTSGSGNIELDPTGTGSINIKGPMVMETGSNISNADGNAVTFGGAINADSISSKTANTDLSITANGTGKVYLNDNAEVSGNLVVGGNLTVSGTTTTVNSETISLADNLIDLNSNFTTGSPTENAGIRIMRGDSSAVQFRWNESSDVWEFTTDGTIYNSVLSINDTALTTALGAKLASSTAATTYAPIASPTFTGTVAGITKSMVGLGNVDNTSDAAKPVSTATQTALDAKLSSATAATTYAPIASPTFTGTVSGVTATHVGLGNVDNTADANKPVSAATQTALDAKLASATAATTYETITNVALKAPLASPALTGTPTAPTATAGTNTTQVATTAYVRGEVTALVASAPAALDTLNELATALNNDASFSTTVSTSIGLKAPLESPTFTGTVSGVTKSHVGLGNVDNTADASKPVSTATQTALDLKAPSASPTFTGTITLPQGKLTGGSTTVSANTATTVSTVALADFTTMEYTVSIKQGSKVRSSKVLVQTDGTAVDSVEHSILETGGTIAGINVTAAVASTNAVLRVTVTDAVTTNAAVKVISTII